MNGYKRKMSQIENNKKRDVILFLKNETEILALKSNNLSKKKKNVPESINNSYELTKGKISKPEDRSVKNM